MNLLKLALPATILLAMIFSSDAGNLSWAEAQAATPEIDSMAARERETPIEDIKLTNSCIDSGYEKIYCLCVTKIFKNEMSLREYRGAAELFDKTDADKILTLQGYSKAEILAISSLSKDLSLEDKFRTRCDAAETYFSAATEG